MSESDDFEYANLSENFEMNDDESLVVARNWYQISTN